MAQRGTQALRAGEHTGRVLVLCAYPTVCRELVAVLVRLGAIEGVVGVPDLAGARAIARRPLPCALVVDLSGLAEAEVEEVVALARDSGCRLVTLASLPDPAVQQRVAAAGGVYLLKQVGTAQLVEAVRSAAQAPARAPGAAAPGATAADFAGAECCPRC